MSCMPAPRPKSPRKLEGSQPPYVCNIFYCFPAKFIIFAQVSVYFVYLHWHKLQAEGQGPRIRRHQADAGMGPFCWGISISRLHCKLCWSAWSEYFSPVSSENCTWMFSPRSIHVSLNMTPSLGPRHDAHLATLSLVWVLWSALNMHLCRGMGLATFRKAKSSFYEIKLFHNDLFSPLGI